MLFYNICDSAVYMQQLDVEKEYLHEVSYIDLHSYNRSAFLFY